MAGGRITSRFGREETGQTLVVIALVVTVLLGAMALGLDWGYSLAQRRVMQNASDAAALATAKLLATSVVGQKQGNTYVPVYTVYGETVYCQARAMANTNRGFRPANATEGIVVQWSSDLSRANPWVSPYGGTLAPPSPGGCPTQGAPGSGTLVDPSARYIRVQASVVYSPFLAGAVGQGPITASASAVAKVTGTQIPSGRDTWPMLRHYNAADFQVACAGSCTPANATPVTFWDSNDPNMVYNDFMGLLDLSRYSTNALRSAPSGTTCADTASTACVPQLIKDWDHSGAAPTGITSPQLRFAANNNACSPPAPSDKWFTNGNENPQSYDKDCSIQNWFYSLFRGQLDLTKDWTTTVWNGTTEFREATNNGSGLATNRGSCNNPPPSLPMPSCTNGKLGDWIEAAHTGNVGNNISTPLQAYIDDFGSGCDASDEYCNLPTGNGANSPTYGKHIVVLVYLWDCAETFTAGNAPGQQWALTRPKNGNDCSSMSQGNEMNSHDSIDRVHLLSVAPFTFYRGMVDSNSIKGFWGGLLTDPGACQFDPSAPGCSSLSIFSNGVFLVPEG